MKMIKFCCEWDKEKENTWSGTPYSLFKAMKAITDVDDAGFCVNKKIYKICGIKYIKGKIYFRTLYNKSLLKMYQKKIDNIKCNKEDKLFEIFDLGISNNPYYIYQDLSIDYLINLKKNDYDAFRYSGFQMFEEYDFERRRKYQLEIYKKASGIFTMSEFLRNDLIENSGISPEKVHCVNAGINLNIKYLKKYLKNKNKILFVGRDFYRKGGDLVVEAFKILKKKYIGNAELYIIGPTKKVLDTIEGDGIFKIENLEYEKLSYFFNICDIFCMPSRFEAYGIVFIEALIYGLPVIARNKFAMSEIINNDYNGYLINDDNVEILAEKMNEALNNNILFENVQKDFDYYINRYSWENVAKKIIKIINNN